jgi:hypothetical protein
MRVSRHRRSAPACELPRNFAQSASVPAGTPASVFVALGVRRPSSLKRHHAISLRGVALRPVALAYSNSPRSALQGALAKWRRTARRKTFQRISERFAGRGPSVGLRVEVRCIVASESPESKEWRSLSEVVDQVLISVGREENAPAEMAAEAPSRKVN